MSDQSLQETVRDLNALELATLVCLVAEEHCIVQTPPRLVDSVAQELERTAAQVFGLYSANIECNRHTTLEDFSEAVVAKDGNGAEGAIEEEYPSRNVSTSAVDKQAEVQRPTNVLDSRKISNMIIAKNLDQAPWNVQIQALELMRSRRIFSRTAVHTAPKRFIFIALLSDQTPGPPFLTPHLNDHFFISHHASALADPDTASLSSTSTTSTQHAAPPPTRRIPDSTLTHLRALTSHVRVSPPMLRYTHDVLTFLRLHRHVGGGVSALAARHLALLARVLAPLHALSYTTPALVKLAARKVLGHRVEVVAAERERSLLWGGSVEAVRADLEGVEGKEVVEEVLGGVPVPL